MHKVSEARDSITVHVGDLYKKYDKDKKLFSSFRQHYLGSGKSRRSSVKYRGKWRTFAYIFTKGQVSLEKRTLTVKDKKTLNILHRLKQEGDLKNYKIVDKTNS